MTDANPSTVSKSTFGWNEKPYAYLLLPDLKDHKDVSIDWTWKYVGSADITISFDRAKSTYLADWQGLDNWFDAGIRKAGQWTLVETWGYQGEGQGNTLTRTNAFTVTPEPFSAALFLFGGIALSTRKFFKKKQ